MDGIMEVIYGIGQLPIHQQAQLAAVPLMGLIYALHLTLDMISPYAPDTDPYDSYYSRGCVKADFTFTTVGSILAGKCQEFCEQKVLEHQEMLRFVGPDICQVPTYDGPYDLFWHGLKYDSAGSLDLDAVKRDTCRCTMQIRAQRLRVLNDTSTHEAESSPLSHCKGDAVGDRLSLADWSFVKAEVIPRSAYAGDLRSCAGFEELEELPSPSYKITYRKHDEL